MFVRSSQDHTLRKYWSTPASPPQLHAREHFGSSRFSQHRFPTNIPTLRHTNVVILITSCTFKSPGELLKIYWCLCLAHSNDIRLSGSGASDSRTKIKPTQWIWLCSRGWERLFQSIHYLPWPFCPALKYSKSSFLKQSFPACIPEKANRLQVWHKTLIHQ